MQRAITSYKVRDRKWAAVFITGILICCILNIYVFNIAITLYLILGSFLLIYFLKHPRTAFYLFVFSIPLAEIYLETPVFSISVVNILILIMIGSLLPGFLITKPKISVPFLIKVNLIALLILVISYVTGAIHAIDISRASRFIITAVGMALSFILPLILIRNLEQYRKVFIFLVASASLLAFFTVLAGFGYFPQEYQDIFATRKGVSRAVIGTYYTQAFMGSRGGYGCWLEAALPITVLSIFYKRKFFLRSKLPLLLMLLVMILGVVVPSSRSTWLASSLAIIITLFFVLRQRYRCSYVVMSIISLLTILTLYTGMIKPLIVDIYEMNPVSVESRHLVNCEGLKIGVKNLIVGIGVGGYSRHIGTAVPGLLIHNVFLSTLVANGILGFVPLIFIWLISFYLCIQIIINPRSEAIKLFGVSLFASLIAIFTEANFYGGGEKIMWLMLGLTNCLYIININCKRAGKPKNPYKLENF